MSDSEDLSVKEGVSVVAELVKAAGSSEEAKDAAKNVGTTAVTVTKTINNLLLPLAAVNFAFDKAREYFAHKFSSDLSEKLSSIPEGKIVEPKASIAGPALQGLAFSHDENELKDLYLNLLKTSMDKRVADTAHPAFVEILKQLSANEIPLFNSVLGFRGGLIPMIEIHWNLKHDGGHHVLYRNLIDVTDEKGSSTDNESLSAMIDNWSRLGLIVATYQKVVSGDRNYEWVENHPTYTRLKESHPDSDSSTVTYKKGCIELTDFGKGFAAAVGIQPNLS